MYPWFDIRIYYPAESLVNTYLGLRNGIYARGYIKQNKNNQNVKYKSFAAQNCVFHFHLTFPLLRKDKYVYLS